MNGDTGKNDKRTITAKASELMPQYLNAMREFGSIVIPVSGTSMTPFVGHMRDTVTLVPAEGKKLKKGDVILYVRQEHGREKYVMHRIVGVRDGAFVLCGDAQTQKEYGVQRQSVKAVAIAARRKGKEIKNKSVTWFFYRHIWRILRPIRPALIRVFGKKASIA